MFRRLRWYSAHSDPASEINDGLSGISKGPVFLLDVPDSLLWSMEFISSWSLDSDSTTGNVIAKRKILGAEMTLINLSHWLLSLQVHSVGNRAVSTIFGLGNMRYGHHLIGRSGQYNSCSKLTDSGAISESGSRILGAFELFADNKSGESV